MRRPFIAGNWKMHKTVAEAEELARILVEKTKGSASRVMIAPPFTALSRVAEVLRGTDMVLGAQNMGPHQSGAHTGEVSPLMLKDVGVQIVILGHSERRHNYGEPNELISTKVQLALSVGLEVILCVGETLEEREQGVTERIVNEQLHKGLEGVGEQQLGWVTIAYEPVWAIGTGKTATPQDAEAIHRQIREQVAEMYSGVAAEELIIQYGGSVKPANIAGLMAMENIDGALVGGASLGADTFMPIVRFDE